MSLEIIAELHPQHAGQPGIIREMIRQAKQNGADAAKFQLYDALKLLGPDWSYLELNRQEVERIMRWCDEEEIEFMASIFDEERLAWCEDLGVPRYKIASRTVRDDPALCETILELGKPTIISLGSWEGQGLPFGQSDQISYLYCKAKYPAFSEDMADFPRGFEEEGLAGYSDHTLGIAFCLLAIANGARILEKHFTLDKTRMVKTERAHVCSMTAAELAELRRVGGSLYRARQAALNAALVGM